MAVTQAFVGTVIAETIASNRGIGNLMMIASSSFDVPLMMKFWTTFPPPVGETVANAGEADAQLQAASAAMAV